MDPPGFEPGASALQGQRSPSLSYGPERFRRIGIVYDYPTHKISSVIYKNVRR